MTDSILSRCGILAALWALFSGSAAQAKDTVYFNDFQTNTAGFTAGGTLTSLPLFSLPTDSGGLGSANQSQWMGRLGHNIPKSTTVAEIATLAVTGLTAGQSYLLAFDLLIGGSWDGSASGFGPDSWRVVIDGTPVVNTTFTNGNQGQEYGAFSPQKYSDTTYLGFSGPNFPKFTGADHFFTTGGSNYAQHYGIYWFGHGAGNPVLSFVATGSTASIEFARYGNTTDDAGEYWALDNVMVSSAIPEPGVLSLLSIASLTSLLIHRRRVGLGVLGMLPAPV
jgi:hypothetical protein